MSAVERSLGTSAIGPTENEAAGRRSFRLSCVAARDLPAAHELRDDDIAFSRPGHGMAPKGKRWLVGRVLAHDVTDGHVLTPEDFSKIQ